MNLFTIVGPLLAFIPLNQGFLVSPPSSKTFAPIKTQYGIYPKQSILNPATTNQNPQTLASSIGIVDTVADPDHDATRGQVFRLPYDPGSKTIGSPIVVDMIGEENPVDIESIGDLYRPEFTKFSRINAMISQNMSVELQDAKWFLRLARDRNFMNEYSRYSHASHGTHVAGVAIDKNPHAKFLSIRFINEFVFSFNEGQKNAINAADNKKLLSSVIEESIAQNLNTMILGLQQRYFSLAGVANQFDIDVLNLSLGIPPGRIVIDNILAINDLYLSEEKIDKLATQYDTAIGDIIRYTLMQCPKTIFVFAAGNEEVNVDKVPYLYNVAKHPRGIVVGAVDGNHKLAQFSNHGNIVVNIAAEGVDIPSSTPGNGIVYMSGTSMAAPAVTHAVAKLIDAGLSPQKVKQVLMETAKRCPELKDHIESGVLDEEAALEKAKDMAEQKSILSLFN
ncbi:MAG: S8 family serine peptidase [Oligoflexales bacterium]|nr:S8 family serine peptidase [Oligoflexales bacterium]